jgi:hypothetical protein
VGSFPIGGGVGGGRKLWVGVDGVVGGGGAGGDGSEDGSDGGAGGDGGACGDSVAAGGDIAGKCTPGGGVIGGKGACSDGAVVRDGVAVGDAGSGEAGEGGVQERGDNCKLPSSPSPRNRSTSQRRFAAFRVRLAGGGEAAGELAAGGDGGAGVDTDSGAGDICGGGVGGGAEILGALAVDKPADGGAVESETAALRRQRRRRPVRAAGVVEVEKGGEREADSDTSCRPAV